MNRLTLVNLIQHGPNQLLSSLLSNVKSVEAKLKLWKLQHEQNNTAHLPTLTGQKPSTGNSTNTTRITAVNQSI